MSGIPGAVSFNSVCASDTMRPGARMSSTYAFTALRVMCRGREDRLRMLLLHGGHPGVKFFDGDAKTRRIAAHFVQRDEAVVTVKSGVFDAFRHHRRAELLEAFDEHAL